MTKWASFKEMFQSIFVTSESYANKWEKMLARVQAKGESLNSYFHSKARACHALRLNIPDTKEYILVGLPSKDLFTAMSSRNHTYLEALLLDMISYERVENQRIAREILSGRSFIDAPGVSYEKRGGQLMFRNDFMTWAGAAATPSTEKPRILEDWEFPPHTEQFVELSTEDQTFTTPMVNPTQTIQKISKNSPIEDQ